MGSESDIDELHSSILSLCEEDSHARTLNQTLNLSPIKSNDKSYVDTPSHTVTADVKLSATEFTPSHDLRSDKRFSFRTHSTPLIPKKLHVCSSALPSESKDKTVLEGEDGDNDLHEMTYEELLSEVTMLCELPPNHLLSSEGPSKLKMEDSIKNLNQTQLSQINMDSILSQSYVKKEEQKKEETPGRFAGLSTTTSASIIVIEDDEDVELSEDILGLDEYIYGDLDSDDNIDEDTLLSGEETVIGDKTLKNDRGVSVSKTASEVLENELEAWTTTGSDNIGPISEDERNKNLKTEKSQKTNVDLNTNTVSVIQKRKGNDFEENEQSKKSKLSDDHEAEPEEKVKKKLKSEKSQSDVEYIVISLLSDSESDSDKSDQDEADLKRRNTDTSVLDNKVRNTKTSALDNKVPTVCVSPLVKHVKESSEEAKDSQGKKSEEKCDTLLDYRTERSFLKNENELTRSVMKKWNSNGIHNPDRNLTHATTFRKKTNGMRGRLEGFHLSTLHGDDNGADPYMKSHVNTRSLAENINKLKMDMNDLEHYYYKRLQEMKYIFNAKMYQQIDQNRNRIRHLRIQQELEARSVHFQPLDLMIKQCKLMQLKMDHQVQMNHVKCVAFNEEKAVRDEYSQKVEMERRRYEEQHNQMSSLVQQLMQQEFEEKDDQFGPHIMVNLVKAPCRNNDEKKSLVSVCLPLDIANATLKEDEFYDRFYEY